MCKKLLSLLLAACLLGCCLLPAAAAAAADAAAPVGRITIRLNSDVAGHTERDVSKFIELKSDNVVFSTRGAGPVYVTNYACAHDTGALVAGRVYYVDYYLSAAEGYALPEKLAEGDLVVECGKGASMITAQIVSSRVRTDSGFVEDYRGLRIYGKIIVDGNFLQRFFGMIYDLILKIKAYQLY